jgi:hypothetical protein
LSRLWNRPSKIEKKKWYTSISNEIGRFKHNPYAISWMRLVTYLCRWFSHRQEWKCWSRNLWQIA